jgi:hypothetical protein
MKATCRVQINECTVASSFLELGTSGRINLNVIVPTKYPSCSVAPSRPIRHSRQHVPQLAQQDHVR